MCAQEEIPMKSRFWTFVALVVIFTTLAAQCGGPPPTPQVVKETVKETVVVTQVV